jgi:hypothetical protein
MIGDRNTSEPIIDAGLPDTVFGCLVRNSTEFDLDATDLCNIVDSLRCQHRSATRYNLCGWDLNCSQSL